MKDTAEKHDKSRFLSSLRLFFLPSFSYLLERLNFGFEFRIFKHRLSPL